jgi:hypothetical protein
MPLFPEITEEQVRYAATSLAEIAAAKPKKAKAPVS